METIVVITICSFLFIAGLFVSYMLFNLQQTFLSIVGAILIHIIPIGVVLEEGYPFLNVFWWYVGFVATVNIVYYIITYFELRRLFKKQLSYEVSKYKWYHKINSFDYKLHEECLSYIKSNYFYPPSFAQLTIGIVCVLVPLHGTYDVIKIMRSKT